MRKAKSPTGVREGLLQQRVQADAFHDALDDGEATQRFGNQDGVTPVGSAGVHAGAPLVGFALPGSITERYQRCGKPQCACHSNPPQLHGPYLQWSRAVTGKTVTKVLTADQWHRYQPWFDHGRRLRELAHELNELTLHTLEKWGYQSTKRRSESELDLESTRICRRYGT